MKKVLYKSLNDALLILLIILTVISIIVNQIDISLLSLILIMIFRENKEVE